MGFQELTGKYRGAALVIGGGYSALRDLERLDVQPAFVLSANHHGFYQDRFPVDFIVSLDRTCGFTQQPHEPLLRQYGVPIIGRQPWADYVIDWPLGCNSGLTAVAVADRLGGDPVHVVGLDLAGGYFGQPERLPIEARSDYNDQIAALRHFASATILARSGPLKGLANG